MFCPVSQAISHKLPAFSCHKLYAISFSDKTEVTLTMRIFFGVLSALAFWFASRRFALSENVGYDIGALFLLLIGIQLFIAAALFHEQHQSRTPRPSVSTDKKEREESGPPGKP